MAKNDEPQVPIKLEWEDVEDIPTVFANHVAVSHASGDEFFLIFGSAAPTTILLRDAPVVDRVPIKPVAKIAISPGAMFRISHAISSNVERFFKRLTPLEDDDADSED